MVSVRHRPIPLAMFRAFCWTAVLCIASPTSAADLTGAHIFGRFSDADWRGANLSSVRMGADRSARELLFRTDLADCNLSGANLAGADLSRALLAFADLTNADLSSAVLAGVDLSRADLTGA